MEVTQEEIERLVGDMYSSSPIAVEVAAESLSSMGAVGAHALVDVALDREAPKFSRVAATRLMHHWDDIGVNCLCLLLPDEYAVLRCWALDKIRDAKLVQLASAVTPLLDDAASFWDLDQKFTIREVARTTLDALVDDNK